MKGCTVGEDHTSCPTAGRRSTAEASRFEHLRRQVTNDDSLTAEVVPGYKQLQRVERAWRLPKSGSKIPPVYHWASSDQCARVPDHAGACSWSASRRTRATTGATSAMISGISNPRNCRPRMGSSGKSLSQAMPHSTYRNNWASHHQSRPMDPRDLSLWRFRCLVIWRAPGSVGGDMAS